jgi:DNA/RNA endonuclease G (NUC1)
MNSAQGLIKRIFPLQSKQERILYLKKQQWEAYYSTANKWPYLTIQGINPGTGQVLPGQELQRQSRADPFRPDPEVPSEYSMTLADYENYKVMGGSPGHNAPASQHRTTIEIYDETFLLSNITPQEIVMNAGVWVILENWVKILGRNPRSSDVYCITGSVAAARSTKFGSSQMNIPTHMFKIITARTRAPQTPIEKNTIHIACFLYPNIPINPTPANTEIWKYLVSLKTIADMTGFAFFPLFERIYGLAPFATRIMHLNKLVPIKFTPNPSLLTQMKRAYYYGALIYSTTVEELDRVWAECQTHAAEFVHMQFHGEYYELAKSRILSRTPLAIPHVTDNSTWSQTLFGSSRS